MSRELYSEGIQRLSAILHKAQGRVDAETNRNIDVGYEVQRLRVLPFRPMRLFYADAAYAIRNEEPR